MAVTPKRLCYGMTSTTKQVVYTCPTNKTAIIKNIIACNLGNALQKYSIWVANKPIVFLASVNTSDSIFIDLSLVVHSGETIEIQGDSVNVGVAFSGVEVDA